MICWRFLSGTCLQGLEQDCQRARESNMWVQVYSFFFWVWNRTFLDPLNHKDFVGIGGEPRLTVVKVGHWEGERLGIPGYHMFC